MGGVFANCEIILISLIKNGFKVSMIKTRTHREEKQEKHRDKEEEAQNKGQEQRVTEKK